MENNVVRAVMESLTGGCMNTVGGDCHYRREYLHLKQQFDEYKKSVKEQFDKLGSTESKLQDYKQKVVTAVQSLDQEAQMLMEHMTLIEHKEDKIFEKGVEFGKLEAKIPIETYKELKKKAETDFFKAQGKMLLMEKSEEFKVANLQQRILELEKSNQYLEAAKQELETRNLVKNIQVLINDIDTIKKEADAMIDTYRGLKRKAVEDYCALHEQCTQLRLVCLNNKDKTAEVEQSHQLVVQECTKFGLENVQLKNELMQRQAQHQHDLYQAKVLAKNNQYAVQAAFTAQLNWLASQFTEIHKNADKNSKIILDVLDNDIYQGKKLKGTAAELKRTLKTIFGEVYEMLTNISKDQEAAATKKEQTEKDMEIIVLSLKELNTNLYEYSKHLWDLYTELTETVGLPMESAEVEKSNAYFQIQRIAGVAEEEGMKNVPSFIFQLKREEAIFRNLSTGVQTWTNVLKAQAGRLYDRKSELEKQLENEKILRLTEKEVSAEKFQIYRKFMVKLRGRLEGAVKSLNPKYIPASRFFRDHRDRDEEEMRKSMLMSYSASPLSNYEEFRIMLNKAEEMIFRIEEEGHNYISQSQ